MTAITTKSRQMRLDNCALNTPKRVQIAGNLRENACKDREAATPADAANAGLENNGKIRQIHPNTKLLGKYRLLQEMRRPLSSLLRRWRCQITSRLIQVSGLVAFTFRSLNSFMRPFVRMPRGFCHLAMSDVGAGYKSH